MYNRAALCLFILVAVLLASRVHCAERLALATATKAPSIRELPQLRSNSTPEQYVRELSEAVKDPDTQELMKQLFKKKKKMAGSVEWPGKCIWHTITGGFIPLVGAIDLSIAGLSLDQCRDWCMSRPECGSVVWVSPVCLLYNINNQFINDHLTQDFIIPAPGYIWSNKLCDYVTGDPSCNEYDDYIHQHAYINTWQHWITHSGFIAGLTADVCQNWCTTYAGCKSVGWHRQFVGFTLKARCVLYSTTIQELIASGQGADVGFNFLSTTYDRHCCPAYNP